MKKINVDYNNSLISVSNSLIKYYGNKIHHQTLELLDNGGDLVQTRENRRKDVETLKREKESFEAEFNESKKKAQDAIDALDRG